MYVYFRLSCNMRGHTGATAEVFTDEQKVC